MVRRTQKSQDAAPLPKATPLVATSRRDLLARMAFGDQFEALEHKRHLDIPNAYALEREERHLFAYMQPDDLLREHVTLHAALRRGTPANVPEFYRNLPNSIERPHADFEPPPEVIAAIAELATPPIP